MKTNEAASKHNPTRGHHRFLKSLSFHQLTHTNDKDRMVSSSASTGMPPRGWVVVKVGEEDVEEERQRFVVPLASLNHPLFARLLEEAEKEYGFRQQGVIVIPCNVQYFMQIQETIEREIDRRDIAPVVSVKNYHHHHHYHRQQSHGHLPHFATACFGRS